MIRAVIFDMDGVLTDSEPVINEAAIRGLREFGVEAEPADFRPFVGMGEDRYIGGVAEAHGVRYRPEMKRRVYEIYLDIVEDLLRVFPGVHRLLSELRNAGMVLAVASSADRLKIEANLRAAEIPMEWFDAVVGAEDAQRTKPAPDIFLAAAGKLRVRPDETCVVEDSPSGVRAAKSAGMRCVGAAHTFPPDVLQKAGADLVRERIAQITRADLCGTGSGPA